MVPPECSGSSSAWHFPQHLTRKASRRLPDQMTEPPHQCRGEVALLGCHPDDQASQPISKGESRHPGNIFWVSCICNYVHYPHLVTMGEGGNVDPPVNWMFHHRHCLYIYCFLLPLSHPWRRRYLNSSNWSRISFPTLRGHSLTHPFPTEHHGLGWRCWFLFQLLHIWIVAEQFLCL